MDLNALRSKNERYVIGLMSGTSCDGIDAALVRIRGTGPGVHVKFLKLASFPYPAALKNQLMSPHFSAHEVCLLNFELGERLADAVAAISEWGKAEGFVADFVASHGHTVAHIPPRAAEVGRSVGPPSEGGLTVRPTSIPPRAVEVGRSAGPAPDGGLTVRPTPIPCGTLQIGESAIIAERSGLPVVSDFRPRDMAAGGQGAPLVPYADWVLFSRPDRTVACLNIGGIANFTVVTPKFDDILAFDTGPGNMAIDGAVRLLTRGVKDMDFDGTTAAKGKVIDEFLDYLVMHPYFDREPPKSTGREEFGAEIYIRDALAHRKQHSYEDLVATITAAVASIIVRSFRQFIRPRYQVSRIIVSGGGARNKTLLAWIQEGLSGITVRTSDQYGISSKAREAIAFAILGNETICGTPANVPQATGATHPVVLGKITPP